MSEHFAPAWRPEAGEQLDGEIVGLDTRMADSGRYAIVTVRTAEGERAVHAFHSVLRRQLAELRPRRGERLVVGYHGRRAGADRDYHAYTVTMPDRPPTDTLDWDALSDEPTAEPPTAQPRQQVVRDDSDDIPF